MAFSAHTVLPCILPMTDLKTALGRQEWLRKHISLKRTPAANTGKLLLPKILKVLLASSLLENNSQNLSTFFFFQSLNCSSFSALRLSAGSWIFKILVLVSSSIGKVHPILLYENRQLLYDFLSLLDLPGSEHPEPHARGLSDGVGGTGWLVVLPVPSLTVLSTVGNLLADTTLQLIRINFAEVTGTLQWSLEIFFIPRLG